VYDIAWTAPRFNEKGTLLSIAPVTAFYNGVLMQNNYQLKGETAYIGASKYKKHAAGPIKSKAMAIRVNPLVFVISG